MKNAKIKYQNAKCHIKIQKEHGLVRRKIYEEV